MLAKGISIIVIKVMENNVLISIKVMGNERFGTYRHLYCYGNVIHILQFLSRNSKRNT